MLTGERALDRTDYAMFAVGLVATAYLSLWACAPLASIPPIMPLDREHPNQLSVAVGGGVGVTYPTIFTREVPYVAGAQGAYVHQFKYLDVGAQMSTRNDTFAAVGALVRARLIETDDLVFGLQASGGWMWMATALPLAVRLGEGIWAYTAPSIGYALPEVSIPLGVSVRLPNIDIFAEAGAGLTGGRKGALLLEQNSVEKVAPYGAAGIGWRW
ncbi:MAG: hypothetical protein HY902_11630 [Deltaproteobacteria bacterium]|nr:hypothetical protein [Deltaproteobacteria bacterium]